MAAVDHHPVIDGLDTQIEASATYIALARQALQTGYFSWKGSCLPARLADFVGIR